MLSAELYARTRAVMCRVMPICEGCPLHRLDEGGRLIPCAEFEIRNPAEAVKLVEVWREENKERYRELLDGKL